jgi:hypothetical protein
MPSRDELHACHIDQQMRFYQTWEIFGCFGRKYTQERGAETHKIEISN